MSYFLLGAPYIKTWVTLVHACRLPLGMPSGPKQRARKLAENLITSPGSSRPAGQGVEREAGYVVLGALCASGLPKAQKVRLLKSVLCLSTCTLQCSIYEYRAKVQRARVLGLLAC